VRAAYAERFGEPLREEDLVQFVEMAREQGFLLPSGGREPPDDAAPSPVAGSAQGADAPRSPGRRQSILYWRKHIFDPDRLFTYLEPKLWFFWTRGFLLVSAGCILLAIFVLWVERRELASSFAQALHWETAVWTWLMLLVVTTLHEFAHGLTCKRYGGEVHEIGF